MNKTYCGLSALKQRSRLKWSTDLFTCTASSWNPQKIRFLEVIWAWGVLSPTSILWKLQVPNPKKWVYCMSLQKKKVASIAARRAGVFGVKSIPPKFTFWIVALLSFLSSSSPSSSQWTTTTTSTSTVTATATLTRWLHTSCLQLIWLTQLIYQHKCQYHILAFLSYNCQGYCSVSQPTTSHAAEIYQIPFASQESLLPLVQQPFHLPST